MKVLAGMVARGLYRLAVASNTGRIMRRRAVIAGLGAAAWPILERAQQVLRIGANPRQLRAIGLGGS